MASQNNPTIHKNGELAHEAAAQEISAVLQRIRTSPTGLSEDEAASRLEEYGPNEVAQERRHEWLHRFWVAVRNPLVILLTTLAAASFVSYFHDKPEDRDVSEFYAGVVMLVMVVLGVSLRLVQETRAGNAAAKLKAMIKVTASVVRDGQQKEIPLQAARPRRRGEIVRR